jgi:amino acid transporter
MLLLILLIPRSQDDTPGVSIAHGILLAIVVLVVVFASLFFFLRKLWRRTNQSGHAGEPQLRKDSKDSNKDAPTKTKERRSWPRWAMIVVLLLVFSWGWKTFWPLSESAPAGPAPIASSNHQPAEAVPTAISQLEVFCSDAADGWATNNPIVKLGPDDHRNDRIDHFDVTLRDDCFPVQYVRVPNFWKTWNYDLVSPGQYVSFWFFGWQHPQGPFHENNLPNYTSPPKISFEDPYAEWRVRGQGVLRYIQTS